MKIINEGLKFNNLTYGNIPNKIVLHNAMQAIVQFKTSINGI